MGLDLYIEAKITEKATGRCISACDPSYTESPLPDPSDDIFAEDGQYFCVRWMCGWDAGAVLNSWISVINRHQKTAYTGKETLIPFPQSALREMCSCLYSYGCSPESSRFRYAIQDSYWDTERREQDTALPYSMLADDQRERHHWADHEGMEQSFVIWANALRRFIYEVERMHYENRYQPLNATDCDGVQEDGSFMLPDDFIPAEEDKQKFRENPQDYAWSFRLFNSY